jgi:hypothetical protein
MSLNGVLKDNFKDRNRNTKQSTNKKIVFVINKLPMFTSRIDEIKKKY